MWENLYFSSLGKTLFLLFMYLENRTLEQQSTCSPDLLVVNTGANSLTSLWAGELVMFSVPPCFLPVLSRLAVRSKQNLIWRALKKLLKTELQANASALPVLPGHLFYCRDYELHWEQKRPLVKHQSMDSCKMLLHTFIQAKWFFFLSVNLTFFDILTQWTHQNLFASDYTWALKPYSVDILAKTTVWHHCKPTTQITTTLPSSPFLCLFYKRSWSCKPWRRGESLHWEAQWDS